MNRVSLGISMTGALLNGAMREKAAAQLSDKMRARGFKNSDVVALIQEVYRHAGCLVPDAAVIDVWLYEGEIES